MEKNKTYTYIVLLAVNIVAMLAIFILGEDKLPTFIFYGGLAYVMISTPLYLYLQLKAITNYYKKLGEDIKK